MKLSKLIFSILTVFFNSSCDVRYFAILVNESGKEINIEIQYDKSAFNDPNTNDIVSHIRNEITNEEIISLDTLNLIAKIKMKSNDTLNIDNGRGVAPRFEIIKNITVHSAKTTRLNSSDEMKDVFKKNENLFIWRIE